MHLSKFPVSQVIEPIVPASFETRQYYHPDEAHDIVVIQRFVNWGASCQSVCHVNDTVNKHHAHRNWKVTQVERDSVHAIVTSKDHNRGNMVDVSKGISLL